MNLPARIRLLGVSIGGPLAGTLRHDSQFTFAYSRDDAQQLHVGLLMPPQRLEYASTALFPVMDQNLPEGFLFSRLRELFPKQALTPMHLLALMGANGIGRLGFHVPDAPASCSPRIISREEILAARADGRLFEELVRAYLSTGVGVSGIQPKIMVPDRATWTVPNLIVKAASPAYPGLAANEFVCLQAARASEILVPEHELSASGELLVLERFDLAPGGARLGFEDIASLMGLHVRDVLSDRKYHGSYERIAEVLTMIALESELPRFFEQVAFSVMVRNGDAHLKNFGVLYSDRTDMRLSPMFDVVTTAIYQYERLAGGPPAEDHTMALKLFKGKGTRTYPDAADLVRFGRDVCRVERPHLVLERIAQGMTQALGPARQDERVPQDVLAQMEQRWELGFVLAREAAQVGVSLRRGRASKAAATVETPPDGEPQAVPRG